MRLVKGDYVMNTDDQTVIHAYKLNGFTEAEEVKPSPAKEPKTTKAKK